MGKSTDNLIALAALSLLVGGVVLMNILLISVAERTKEIGLRRAVGATQRDIFLQFLVESLSVSFLGMAVIEPDADEIPYVDTSRPLITDVAEAGNIVIGDPRTQGLMARRYEAYKSHVVRPFFREHFARLDRQVVLVDVLSALHAGPEAFDNLRMVMGDVMGAFKPGRNGFFRSFFTGRRVEKLLFAATKADHLHHRQHARLQALAEALLAEARQRADYSGAKTEAVALASCVTVSMGMACGGRAGEYRNARSRRA